MLSPDIALESCLEMAFISSLMLRFCYAGAFSVMRVVISFIQLNLFYITCHFGLPEKSVSL